MSSSSQFQFNNFSGDQYNIDASGAATGSVNIFVDASGSSRVLLSNAVSALVKRRYHDAGDILNRIPPPASTLAPVLLAKSVVLLETATTSGLSPSMCDRIEMRISGLSEGRRTANIIRAIMRMRHFRRRAITEIPPPLEHLVSSLPTSDNVDRCFAPVAENYLSELSSYTASHGGDQR